MKIGKRGWFEGVHCGSLRFPGLLSTSGSKAVSLALLVNHEGLISEEACEDTESE